MHGTKPAMNVLVVSSKYPPEYAGSGLRAHRTYKRLARKFGIGFEVLASSVSSNTNRNYVFEGASVRRIGHKVFNTLSPLRAGAVPESASARMLLRIVRHLDYWVEAVPAYRHVARRASQYDLIHVFGNVPVTAAAVAYARIARKPLVIELVNMVETLRFSEPAIVSRLLGKRFPRQTLMVCISGPLREVCRRYGFDERQIWCRPNPADESRFYFERLRKQHYLHIVPGLSASDVVLVYIAKFMPSKNQRFLLDVMQCLPDRYKLVLAGPLVDAGPLRERDQAYYASIVESMRASGLDQRVHLIPRFLEAPESYMKAADVFVMPTVKEAFGTPVVEALACGVPVVANHIPGVFDQWIDNGQNGFVCGLDPRQWAEKIAAAAQLGQGRMRQASEAVLRVAATEIIDRQYYDYMCALTGAADGTGHAVAAGRAPYG